MQPYMPCDLSSSQDDSFDKNVQTRIQRLVDRVVESLCASAETAPGGHFFEPIPAVDRSGVIVLPFPDADISPMQWRSSMNHYLGSHRARDSTTIQGLHDLLKSHQYQEFRHELARAELAGEVSEFHALNFQAILAILERSELAGDYLEMAEVAAATPYERAVIAENLAAYELLQGDSYSAARRCLDALDHVYQTEGLWNNLLIALYRLGELEVVDETLRGFARLNDECSTRLARLLSSDLILVRFERGRSFMSDSTVEWLSKLTARHVAATLHSSRSEGPYKSTQPRSTQVSSFITKQHQVSLNGG